jgi:hypothetical protein
MCRCAAGGDLEEPLIAHPQCCYFEGAQGTIGCYSDVATLRPYWRKLLVPYASPNPRALHRGALLTTLFVQPTGALPSPTPLGPSRTILAELCEVVTMSLSPEQTSPEALGALGL